MSPKMISVSCFEPLCLHDHEVHVWFGEPGRHRLDTAVENSLVCLYLDAEERARYNRYKVDEKRQEFLIGRVFLKKILAQYLNTLPEEVGIRYSSKGKPVLGNGNRLQEVQFSLSHSQQGFACVVGLKHPVGIDIESVTPIELGPFVHALAAEEIAYLSRVPHGEKPRHFFRIWTLKEAFLKANDSARAISPVDFYFLFGNSDIQIHTRKTACSCAPGRWKFCSMMPTQEYLLATAVQTEDPAGIRITYSYLDFDFLQPWVSVPRRSCDRAGNEAFCS